LSPVEVEFWPEYGSGPLWIGGSTVEPAELGSAELAERLIRWNDDYADDKLPLEGEGDPAWLAEGKELLDAVRVQLPDTHVVLVNEDWFD
jgi:succinylarginine dihydrolase